MALALLLFAAIAAGLFTAGRVTVPAPPPTKYTRLTFQRGGIGAARFRGPEAKEVVYSAEWEGRPPALFQIQADGKTPAIPLNRAGLSLLSVAPDGDLALIEHPEPGAGGETGRLLILPASLGAPRPQYSADARAADWGPGKRLAIVNHVAGEDRLEMPPGTIQYRTAGHLASVRVSSDGRFIAARELPKVDDSRGWVVVIDATSQTPPARSVEFGDTRGTVNWGWNGREIWFSAANEGATNRLRAVPRRQVTDGAAIRSIGFPASAILQDVARDGRKLLVFQRHRAAIRVGSDEGEFEPEPTWFDFALPYAMSGDGSTLLFGDSGDNGGPDYTLLLGSTRRSSAAEPTRLETGYGLALSADGAFALALRKDRLVLIPTAATVTGESKLLPAGPVRHYQSAGFVGSRNSIVFVAAEERRPLRTWIQDIPDGLPRRLTEEGILGSVTDPQGRFLAALTGDGRLAIVSLDGGALRDLGKVGGGYTICQWSGDTLYLQRARARLEVLAVDVRTGRQRPWRSIELPDRAGLSYFNFVMARDARTYAYGYIRRLDELFVVEGLR
jgi:hypothetical protein